MMRKPLVTGRLFPGMWAVIYTGQIAKFRTWRAAVDHALRLTR